MGKTLSLSGETSPQRHSASDAMRPEDQYLKFVHWSEEDARYVGYCPDLFPWGGVCEGQSEEETYGRLRALVGEEIEQLTASVAELPPPVTRPMRESAGV
jgi:hypothetical protein